MKQILQNLNNGVVDLADIPCPKLGRGQLLIQTLSSLISAGTERMLLDFGKANLLQKASQQPDKVRMVYDKMRTDGIMPTLSSVRNKLGQPLPLGYCNTGIVLEVGADVVDFTVGDMVASNGPHAEIVCVPANLCAKVPSNVCAEDAAFTVIAAIALQGIRLAQPTLGEKFVVSGLGLIGLLTVQLLRANGCQVLGIDFAEDRLAIARQFGAQTVNLSKDEDALAVANALSQGWGMDGAILTVATKSNDPMQQAAQICRQRGRIILVGVAGLELSRADFFAKELSFQVSCSYGPGRYDPQYEQQGHDYPFGFVRWTAQRNFQAVLSMIADGHIEIEPLRSHQFPLADYRKAYELLGSTQPSLGILLHYAKHEKTTRVAIKQQRSITLATASRETTEPVIAIIGAGNYTKQVLAPAFSKTQARLKSIASAGGVSGVHVGHKYGFENTTTDIQTILQDPEINAVVIATRHHLHAQQVCAALAANKHVFVEKPLALNRDELKQIERAYADTNRILTVGFNRRFSPHIRQMKSLLDTVKEPKSFIVTVNAGIIPTNHWTQDKNIGGGRIIGEACHFIDVLLYLVGYSVSDIHSTMMGGGDAVEIHEDKISFTLRFEDGSFGSVHYLANGNKSFPKERIEVFCAGRVLQLDNFRKLTGWGWPNFRKMNLWRQDKGQTACVQAFVNTIRKDQVEPILFADLLAVSKISFEIVATKVP